MILDRYREEEAPRAAEALMTGRDERWLIAAAALCSGTPTDPDAVLAEVEELREVLAWVG